MEVLRIKDTEIFLDDMGEGKGKITISNTYGYNFSHYWGAMGGDLKSFINGINKYYFTDKLLGHKSGFKFCPKKTKSNIRRMIKEEKYILPWYKHMEFQKDMREKINTYFTDCEDVYEFMYSWDRFVNDLDYYLIDRSERDDIESFFKGMSEVWYLAGERPDRDRVFLYNIFEQLKKEL